MIDYTRYLGHDELTGELQRLHAEFPELMKLQSIGQSHQGRSIWLATITNRERGSEDEKPGYWIDANIHAEEVVGSMVALYTVEQLLRGYAADERIARLVDEQVFYVVPRLNPDAAELCLTTRYPWCGNGRVSPDEVQSRGLRRRDLNGDGYVTMMRVPDPQGEWKVSEFDERLMARRGPDETGGRYFRLLPEGDIPDYDGAEIVLEPPGDGNLNRNFPANFLPEEQQYGAGRYPLSEPESRAAVEFITAHPNVVGAQSYHTHGGVILRPFLNRPDSDFAGDDLTVYRELGALGTEETGYPVVSVYEEFTTDKASPRTGSFMEWMFEQLGILTFSTELWDIWRVAGVVDADYFRFKDFDDAEHARLLAWVDEHAPGGFVDWQPCDHPQLGPVEIGGWVSIWTFRNPPGTLIRDECERNFRFTLRHAAAAPRIELPVVEAARLGDDLYRVRAIIANAGFLPTNVSTQALNQRVARPVTASLRLPEGAELLMGEGTLELGHLAGRSERRAEWSPWGPRWGTPRRVAEWLVRARPGASVWVEARSEKAGVARARATIRSGYLARSGAKAGGLRVETSHGWFDVKRFPDGVTMIAEPGHYENVKSYLVEGERDVAVLDTGMGVGDFAGLVRSLTDREPIVLHSHAHFDHIGASARFGRVLVHPAEADDLRAGYPNDRFRPWFEPHYLVGDLLPVGFDPETAAIAPAEPTGTLLPGDRIDLGGRVLDVFHTPGHSPGGITLLDRERRLLFPGDAVYGGPMFAYRAYSDPVAYRETLRLLAELAAEVDVVYPSHNEVPLTPEDVVRMHEAYEAIWHGRQPDQRQPDRDVFEFDSFSFWLRPGAYGERQ